MFLVNSLDGSGWHTLKDERGNVYGRLTVLALSECRKRKRGTVAYWTCRCDCGAVCVKAGVALRIGEVKSCGCLRAETARRIGHDNKGRPGAYHGDPNQRRDASGKFFRN